MSVDYRCPYCGKECSDPDYWENEPETPYEVDCECGKTFVVSYVNQPVFATECPNVCIGDYSREQLCCYWNIFENCCWFNQTAHPHDCPVNGGCPMGHVSETTTTETKGLEGGCK